MNYFLRIFIWLSMVLLALSVTAVSCNKVGGDKSNNNNNSGDSNNPPPAGTIVFENFDTDVAEMVNGTIQLKASGFLDNGQYFDFVEDMSNMLSVGNPHKSKTKRAFDITISSQGAKAKEGLIMVGPGNLANVNAFSLDRLTKVAQDFSEAEKREGVVGGVRGSSSADSFRDLGWSIFGVFMNTNVPKNAAEADPKASPFAFTPTTGTFAVHPFLLCQAIVTSITTGFETGAPGTLPARDTTKLEGGQKASCYVGSAGNVFSSGKAANDWFDATTANFKRKFNIAVAGLKTDGKTIADLGLKAADKAAAFRDGITTAEMKEITAVTTSGYTNIAVEVVKGTLPGYTAPTAATISIGNFDAADEVRANTAGDAIRIKASAFPTTATSTTITDGIGSLATITDVSTLKRVFDITVAGGGKANNATGGLVMVGPGNFTKIDDFSDQGGGGANSLPTTFKEGFGSGTRDGNTLVGGKYQQGGINYYGVFMNDTAPTVAGADTSPFAFTASGGSHPFLFCRATLTAFSGGYNPDHTFAGGQTASCYIGSKGTAFSGQSATWLATTPSANFKKTFNIAIGAIRTDAAKTSDILSGATIQFKMVKFVNEGLSSTDIAKIASRYSSILKTVSVTIVESTAW